MTYTAVRSVMTRYGATNGTIPDINTKTHMSENRTEKLSGQQNFGILRTVKYNNV